MSTKTTLSQFFPEGTEYFYSYPTGDHSNFFNSVDPEVEELVAARLLACAGDTMKIVVFDATHASKNMAQLRHDLGIPEINHAKVITLPQNITSDIRGKERNDVIKTALKNLTTKGNLVMAQPFLDADVVDYYQIDPALSVWLNDKKNMHEYIPSAFLPERQRTYVNGPTFAKDNTALELPCVIKVTSSSSGDGVHMCHDELDIAYAKKKFGTLVGTIIVEKYIEAEKNFGIQFAIPYNSEQEVQIIGFNQQITTESGEFMGGLIDSVKNHSELPYIYSILELEILPKIRAKGWCGVGGFDVLVAKDGSIHFIDSNFRATGMTTYIFMVKNGLINHSLISFAATYHGTAAQLRRDIMPLTKGTDGEQLLSIISLTKKNGLFRLNAAMQFENETDMHENATFLIQKGLHSSILRDISHPSVHVVEHSALPVLALSQV
jgi:hypothetical protein